MKDDFPLTSGRRQGCALSPLPFSIILEVLSIIDNSAIKAVLLSALNSVIRQENEIKVIHWKGRNKTILTHRRHAWLCRKFKVSTTATKILELVNECQQAHRIKDNHKKYNPMFLY